MLTQCHLPEAYSWAFPLKKPFVPSNNLHFDAFFPGLLTVGWLNLHPRIDSDNLHSSLRAAIQKPLRGLYANEVNLNSSLLFPSEDNRRKFCRVDKTDFERILLGAWLWNGFICQWLKWITESDFNRGNKSLAQGWRGKKKKTARQT